MYWCSLFRTVLLLQLLSGTKLLKPENGPKKSEWNPRDEAWKSFMEAIGLMCHMTPPTGEWQKPICKEKVGCDVPLNCFDYSSLTRSTASKVAGARKVTPHNLERILENPSITNTCAVVMFYAPWCPYSVDFARQFNALGRSYRQLPVLAVEFSESDM